MGNGRTIAPLALSVLLLTAGCLGGLGWEDGSAPEQGVHGTADGFDRGTVFVRAADQPPEVPLVPHTNETVQSTEPLQTALDRYRDGESGLVLHVEGEEYGTAHAAIRELARGTAPAGDVLGDSSTYVELEDEVVRVGVTVNATA